MNSALTIILQPIDLIRFVLLLSSQGTVEPLPWRPHLGDLTRDWHDVEHVFFGWSHDVPLHPFSASLMLGLAEIPIALGDITC